MKTLSVLGMTVVTLAASVLWATDPEAVPTTYTPRAERGGLSLDLRVQTTKTLAGGVDIPYSSVGWETLPVDAGEAVTLMVTPEGGEETVVAEGLTGRSTFLWTPVLVDYGRVYRFSHLVVKDGVTNHVETLQGRTVFVEAGDIEPRQVFADGSAVCPIRNDAANPWRPGEAEADGILAPAGTSVFSFKPMYGGTLTFDYILGAGPGTLTVYVDNALVATLSATDVWTESPMIVLSGAGVHCVEVRGTNLMAEQAGLKQAVWVETDCETTSLAVSGVFRVDLAHGVRCVRERADILPVVYSPTNFTGIVETAEPTVARVRLVQLTGDEVAGVASWTNAVNEIVSTERILVGRTSAESSVAWRAKSGVWKLTFDILTGDVVARSEYAIFDARGLKQGLVLLLK